MNYFYLDASAYAKFYYPEPGTDMMAALFDTLPGRQARRLVMTLMTIAETVAVLNRRRNELRMTDAEYDLIVARLLADVAQFTHWRLHDEDLLNATVLISVHNLNSSDALHLHTALRLERVLHRTRQDRIVMVASDKRLLRASGIEGLATLDPEEATRQQVHDLAAAD